MAAGSVGQGATLLHLDDLIAEKSPTRTHNEPLRYWECHGSATEMPFTASVRIFGPEGVSARHRHTFEQIRYVLSGSMTFGRGLVAGEGDCVYFPEGEFYGPTTYDSGCVFLIQWRGPSEKGLHLEVGQLRELVAKLKANGGSTDPASGGEWKHADGRHQDVVEAAQELYTGGDVEYAPSRYNGQIIARGNQFAALPVSGAAGVRVRHLGYFNEVGPNVKVLDFEPGGILPAATTRSQQLWMVVKGELDYDGAVYETRSMIYLPPGTARAEIRADEFAKAVVVHLRTPSGPEMPFSEF
jgi:quercetin dioxygenase-like cupin family protein